MHATATINTAKSRTNVRNFGEKVLYFYVSNLPNLLLPFLRATAIPAGTAEARISYGNSVCLSVCLSRPGTDSRPGEIETPGLHHVIA